jgi:3-methyladenine DNA glycosylase/8-oxoguanine DNA glycosylase
MHLRAVADSIEVTAWGPGGDWTLEHAPELLGFDDDASDFQPFHPVLRDAHRRLAGLRIGRTSAVVEALVPSILEQKVAGKEAWRSYAGLVHAVSEPAPGPLGLLLPPSPERLGELPYHAFHRFGIERRRAVAMTRACGRARRLEETTTMSAEEAHRRLTAFPGIGEWTAAEVATVALGDPDAVSVGDYHLPHVVSWALAGEPRGDDDRMLELLEPYRGHRGRVIRLIEAAGMWPPRFGPRQRLRSIAGM